MSEPKPSKLEILGLTYQQKGTDQWRFKIAVFFSSRYRESFTSAPLYDSEIEANEKMNEVIRELMNHLEQNAAIVLPDGRQGKISFESKDE